MENDDNDDNADINTLNDSFSAVSVNPKINYIKLLLKGYPELKLDAYKIYNNHVIVKNGEWNQFKKSVDRFLENKHNEYIQSHLSRVPKSSRPTSTRPPASAHPSTRPLKSTIAKENERIANWWALHNEGKTDEAQLRFGANKGALYSSGVGGGSRRRRTSHRKRKSYRKSKCVRHTRRKQTRRHRHRRSRHRR
jgi:hypothetical protein